MSLPIKLLLFRFWLSWRSQSLLRWRQRLKCRCAIPAAETDRSCVPRLSAWALFFHCRERTSLCTALMTGINFLTQDHFYPSHLWNMSDRIRTWEGSLQACAIMQGNSFLSGVYFSVMSLRRSLWERLWGWKHNNFSVRPAAQSLKLQPGRQDEMSALNASANRWCVHMF